MEKKLYIIDVHGEKQKRSALDSIDEEDILIRKKKGDQRGKFVHLSEFNSEISKRLRNALKDNEEEMHKDILSIRAIVEGTALRPFDIGRRKTYILGTVMDKDKKIDLLTDLVGLLEKKGKKPLRVLVSVKFVFEGNLGKGTISMRKLHKLLYGATHDFSITLGIGFFSEERELMKARGYPLKDWGVLVYERG